MLDAAKDIAGIRFSSSATELSRDQVRGFFVDWPNPPDESTLLLILAGSDLVELAIDESTGHLVGFVTAVSDGVLAAYLPLLEVLPAYQQRGIGSHLVRRMLLRLGNLYMIDVLCDPELVPFYEQLGMQPASGAIVRNYDNQSGAQV